MNKAGLGPPLLVVAAALIDAEGRVLVQQRPPGKSHAGLWEFPGGKVEPGERPEAALARELGEELGIGLDPAALAPVSFATGEAVGRSLVLLLFAGRVWTGEPRPLDAVALRWCGIDALRALPMPPVDVALIDPLARRA
ncbi:(deoxy)nucleoside triphosphate pyrophosphohydrolase [Hephaestia sp. GCM10023244]|uniref:(deoxy)nucleoside triphosphate pyrophosphohydrolase n=1 Tax=unclassified Hephaestia TaxID=2631281 RepID=UPI0020777A42|nr:(deoxy)nucleoside triphosphate pyrophosphohydrolase [Hephaestia sp. MAHUQ-44]MCM8729848.1 (deoxy)nucleoside triphosphate pyrophosphohydrolase [Hephaestia sp. MAHUQ-44]